ncbi:Protein mgr2 [Golovinomyces cichoracearum]|uniref:Protein mgr2 n=1 Tax=Golovinomyces cichoracearum TaxID=62708 RepID=A0A420IEX7_9PEZI|nr:Protein mgr2 [Golovinomyces cichoracearum]
MPVSVGSNMSGPSIFDKFKMGAMMGSSSVNIIRFGAGSNGIMRTLGNYMLGSGATFGFFMSIGSMVRTDTISPSAIEAFARSQRRTIILPRINNSPPKNRC